MQIKCWTPSFCPTPSRPRRVRSSLCRDTATTDREDAEKLNPDLFVGIYQSLSNRKAEKNKYFISEIFSATISQLMDQFPTSRLIANFSDNLLIVLHAGLQTANVTRCRRTFWYFWHHIKQSGSLDIGTNPVSDIFHHFLTFYRPNN